MVWCPEHRQSYKVDINIVVSRENSIEVPGYKRGETLQNIWVFTFS